MEVYDESNYEFVGKPTMVSKGNEVQYVQIFES
ncbi:hypothetical protein ACUXIQ_001163 [Staphylococcus hominis]